MRKEPECINGSKHLYRLIDFARRLDPPIFKIICKTISNNGYYAHSENIILSMITDTDKKIRMEGYQRISEAREIIRSGVRKFKVPKINFKCGSFIDMIQWSPEDLYEPPVTRHLTDQQIRQLMIQDDVIDVPNFPCHTQHVEHCIPAVSEAVKRVYETDNQNDYLRNKLFGRNMYSNFNSKQDWKFQ